MPQIDLDKVDPSLRPFLNDRARRGRATRQVWTTLVGGPVIALIVGLVLRFQPSDLMALVLGLGVPTSVLVLLAEWVVKRANHGSLLVKLFMKGLVYGAMLTLDVAFVIVAFSETRAQQTLEGVPAEPGVVVVGKAPAGAAGVAIKLKEFFTKPLVLSIVYDQDHSHVVVYDPQRSRVVTAPPGSLPDGRSPADLKTSHLRVSFTGLVYGVCFAVFALVNLASGIRSKIGPTVAGRWLRGYYFKPRIERRVFLFLDMNSSTSLAETLGDEKYSAMLRDYYADLTSPIEESSAEVVHYVGDEVVLSWLPKRGLDQGRCLRCFYHFKAVLQGRSDYYLEHYGVVPGFKAGAHIGSAVATEVGTIKSELVFHGDVVNTGSRIMTQCADARAELLVSKSLADGLPPLDWLHLEPVGKVALKGKQAPETLLKVTVAAKVIEPRAEAVGVG